MCNTSCGMGFQSRSRTCTNPTPKYRGRTCQQRRLGEARESRTCNTNVNCPGNKVIICISHGVLSERLETETCNVGSLVTKYNIRQAINCYKKNVFLFIENEGYTPWSPWSKLSATCGEKTQFRKRFCINIPSGNGGTSCKGKDEDTKRRTVMQICSPGILRIWSLNKKPFPTSNLAIFTLDRITYYVSP